MRVMMAQMRPLVIFFLEGQIQEQWKDVVDECSVSACLVTLGQISSHLSSDDSYLYCSLVSAFVFLEKCLSKQITFASS